MSKQVDERVVEMRFDNSQFESNVKTTMSTLDKLKAALKFPTKTDGLSSLAKGASNVTSGINTTNTAVTTLKASFSALQIMGVTALANITNSAVNAGKQVASALTIQPIMSGYSEYETQLNSIQTILSNTRSKGTTIDDVTAALDELNKYADQTIYNFTEMTRNIGTFTAAGVGLDESVQAIKGIANLAAMSGSTSQQASTAMYQLSQALATGRVSLMDWNSVVNAGMGGEVFQEALKRTARSMGIAVDEIIEKEGSFRDSLTKGQWLTADVLTETLAQIAGAYDESALLSQGYTKQQAADILDLAQNATDAATKVTTFTKLLDTLGEALGSGWTNTWETILGDFYTAQDFWTNISNYLGDIINQGAEARNSLLAAAFDSPWEQLQSTISETGIAFSDYEDKVKEVAKEHGIAIDEMITGETTLQDLIQNGTIGPDLLIEAFGRLADAATGTSTSTEDLTKKLEEFQTIVDQVWRGDFGNGAERMQKLADAGQDYATIQALVNKTVDGHRLTLDDLSDEQLKSIGYTEEQVTTLRDLQQQAEETGTPLNELINNLTKPSGRELLFQSIQRLLQAIIGPMQAFSNAWGEVFTVDSGTIYDILEGFNGFTEAIVMDKETLDKLTRTFKGLFSIIKIVATTVRGALSAAFGLISPVVGDVATDFLDLAANMGDTLFEFANWYEQATPFVDLFTNISNAIKGFADRVMNLQFVQDIGKWFSGAVSGVERFFGLLDRYMNGEIDWEEFLGGLTGLGDQFDKGLSEFGDIFMQIGKDIINGLVKGVTEQGQSFIDDVVGFFNKFVEAVKAFLGIQSPSTVFFEIGKNIIEGLVNGIKYVSGQVIDTLSWLIGEIKGLFADVDWGAVLGLAAGVGAFAILWQFTTALQGFAAAAKNFADPFGSLGEVFRGFSSIETQFANYLKEKKWTVRAEAVKTLAIALGILTVAIIALANQDIDKLWDAVKVIGALAAIMAALMAVINLFNGGSTKDTIKIGGMLAAMSIVLIAFAAAIAIMSGIDATAAGRALSMITLFGFIIIAMIAVSKYAGNSKQVLNLASFLKSVGVAFVLMAASIAILGNMDAGKLQNGIDAIETFAVIIGALMLVTRLLNGTGRGLTQMGNMLKSVGTAFLLMTAAVAILGNLKPETIRQGSAAITYFTALIVGLMAATKLVGGKSLAGVGTTILGVSASFTLMAIACGILGSMDPAVLDQGLNYITKFAGLIVALVAVLRVAGGGQIAKVGATLLAMSISIGILAGISVLLGMVKTENLVKGIAAIGALSVMVSLMTFATRGANDVKGTMMGIAVAIGVLAAAIAVLSFIEPERLASSVAGLSVAMLALSMLVNSISKMGEASKGTVASVAIIIGVIGALAGVIAILSTIDATNTLPNAVALSALLVALGGAMKLMGNIQEISLKSAGTLAAMVAVVLALSGVIAILSQINPQNVLPNAVALSALLLALSAAIRIMGDMNGVNVGGAAGVLAAVVIAMYALTGVMAILQLINCEGMLPKVITLGVLLAEMTAVTFALSKMGNVDPVMVSKAALALDAVTVIIGVMVGLVGALEQLTNGGLSSVMASGAEVFEQFGAAIGKLIGGIIGGVGAGIMDTIGASLPGFGLSLSQFMTNLTPFLMGLKMVSPDMLVAAQNLSDAILKLSASSLIDAVSRFLGGGINWSDLGTQMGYLGGGLSGFAQSVQGLDLSNVGPAAQAVQQVCDAMSKIDPEGGLAGLIFGEKNYEGFGSGMEAIGTGLNNFVEAVGDITPETVQPAADALNTIITTMSSIPSEGGLLGAVLGGTYDYEKFATGMDQFGQGLYNFVSAVSQIGDFSIIGPSSEALNTLITTMSSIPKSGGLVDMLFGDGTIDYSTFSTSLVNLGKALYDYYESVNGVDTDKLATVTTRLTSLLTLLKQNVDKAETIKGGADALKNIEGVGTSVANFYNNMNGVTGEQLDAATQSLTGLITVINSMAGMDTSGVSLFQNAVEQLAGITLDNVTAAFSSIDLSGVGASFAQSLANGMAGAADDVANKALAIAKACQLLLRFQAGEFETIGELYSTSMGNGVGKGTATITSAFQQAIGTVTSYLTNRYGAFYTAGLYVAQGFANGISRGAFAARIAAQAMANSAAEAARRALNEHSPSKVFYEIGAYAGQGMVNALSDYSKYTYAAGRDMGDEATDGLRVGMNDILNESFDMNPTITPVIDLTNAKSGIDYLNNALNGNGTYSVFGQLNRINRGANSARQNGTTDDVIRELSRLRGDIQSMPVNQYNVNGITYDDGSAMAGTVRELVRAARIERRR